MIFSQFNNILNDTPYHLIRYYDVDSDGRTKRMSTLSIRTRTKSMYNCFHLEFIWF